MESAATSVEKVIGDRIAKIVYGEGANEKAFRGRVLGLTDDRKFLVVQGGLGDSILIAVDAIRTIIPEARR